MAMKTVFQLREYSMGGGSQCGTVEIQNKHGIKVSTISGRSYYMAKKDLECFAVNILKALKSKKLKPSKRK